MLLPPPLAIGVAFGLPGDTRWRRLLDMIDVAAGRPVGALAATARLT